MRASDLQLPIPCSISRGLDLFVFRRVVGSVLPAIVDLFWNGELANFHWREAKRRTSPCCL